MNPLRPFEATRLFVFFIAICLSFQAGAQSVQAFPFWDARSPAWLYGSVGAGYQFGNQNQHFYFFTEATWCASCHVVQMAKDWSLRTPYDYVRANQNRLNVHVRFQTNREQKLYGLPTKPDNSYQGGSWTFFSGFGFSGDFGMFRKKNISDENLGLLTDAYYRRSKLTLRYDITSRFNIWRYRKLSNTIGSVNIGVSALDDRWGGSIGLGNDFLVVIFNKLFCAKVPAHDHGETNSIHVQGWYRPSAWRTDDPNTAPVWYPERVQKWHLHNFFRMITNRQVANAGSSSQARYGVYEVTKNMPNSFHGYLGSRLSVEGGFYNASLAMGVDAMRLGRDAQRWAHQKYYHTPPQRFKRILFKSLVIGSPAPLFPWENQPGYYKKPKKFYELNLETRYQTLRGF